MGFFSHHSVWGENRRALILSMFNIVVIVSVGWGVGGGVHFFALCLCVYVCIYIYAGVLPPLFPTKTSNIAVGVWEKRFLGLWSIIESYPTTH